MDIIKCKKCGYELFPSDTVCERCGTPVNNVENANDLLTKQNKGLREKNIEKHINNEKNQSVHKKNVREKEPLAPQFDNESKWVTAKLIIGIISIVLFIIVFFESCVASVGDALLNQDGFESFTGVISSFLYLIAGIVGICTRKSGKGAHITVCGFYFFILLLTSIASENFADLKIWGIIAFIFGCIYLFAIIRSRKGYIISSICLGVFFVFCLSLFSAGSADSSDSDNIVYSKDEQVQMTEIESSEISSDAEIADSKVNKTKNKTKSMYLEDQPDTDEKIIKGIKVETKEVKADNSIAVFLTNNNEYVIPYLEVQILFYKDGSIVSTDRDGHDVLVPRNTVLSELSAPNDYDDYDIKISIDWGSKDYRNWIYNLDINSNVGEDTLILQIKNNSEFDIDEIEYIVALYKNDELMRVTYAKDVTNVAAGDTIIEDVLWYDGSIKPYDAYEIYINQAHTFGAEYTKYKPLKETLPEGIACRNRIE